MLMLLSGWRRRVDPTTYGQGQEQRRKIRDANLPNTSPSSPTDPLSLSRPTDTQPSHLPNILSHNHLSLASLIVIHVLRLSSDPFVCLLGQRNPLDLDIRSIDPFCIYPGGIGTRRTLSQLPNDLRAAHHPISTPSHSYSSTF